MNKKLKKEIYKKLCLKQQLTDYEKKEYDLFKLSGGEIGLIKNKCCYCGKELNKNNFFIVTSYWNSTWKPTCSEKCAQEGFKKEEYLCQEIDKNCNECKYFERKSFEKIKPQTYNLFQSIGGYLGICKNKKSKFYNKKVGANRNTYQGMGCFINRKNNSTKNITKTNK